MKINLSFLNSHTLCAKSARSLTSSFLVSRPFFFHRTIAFSFLISSFIPVLLLLSIPFPIDQNPFIPLLPKPFLSGLVSWVTGPE
jgi:hypothetical protein